MRDDGISDIPAKRIETARAGIWRASWRNTLVHEILGCSQSAARDAARHLNEWCRCAAELEREVERVTAEVHRVLREQSPPNDGVREAVMDDALSILRGRRNGVSLEFAAV